MVKVKVTEKETELVIGRKKNSESDENFKLWIFFVVVRIKCSKHNFFCTFSCCIYVRWYSTWKMVAKHEHFRFSVNRRRDKIFHHLRIQKWRYTTNKTSRHFHFRGISISSRVEVFHFFGFSFQLASRKRVTLWVDGKWTEAITQIIIVMNMLFFWTEQIELFSLPIQTKQNDFVWSKDV